MEVGAKLYGDARGYEIDKMNRPLAIIPVRNEADILPWVVKHLVEQGCDIHLIDNWSTDWSSIKLPWDSQYDQRIRSEMWPSKGPDSYWQWTEMLQRIEEIAQAHDGWVIFNDADEIRRSPRTGETIADGLARVALRGYNAIAFRLYEFWPTDNSYIGDPESHFTHYRDDSLDSPISKHGCRKGSVLIYTLMVATKLCSWADLLRLNNGY